MKIINLIAASIIALPSCYSDPLTNIPKFKTTGTNELPGLELDGYLRKSEAINAGYIFRRGQWTSPTTLEQEKEDQEFLKLYNN